MVVATTADEAVAVFFFAAASVSVIALRLLLLFTVTVPPYLKVVATQGYYRADMVYATTPTTYTVTVAATTATTAAASATMTTTPDMTSYMSDTDTVSVVPVAIYRPSSCSQSDVSDQSSKNLGGFATCTFHGDRQR